MRSLVVGQGSIGSRHARLLASLGCETAVVSARAVDHPHRFPDLGAALEAWAPGYVVVANATDRHRPTLLALAEAGWRGRLLVEKPLFDAPAVLPALPFERLGVAYNLRFHPVLLRLHELLRGEPALSVQAYVGQYLPGWRPGTDYRTSYSSQAARGGGVLRDLSHELDFLQHLFGPWRRVAALGGHFSHLEGDSDDSFGLLLACERCPLLQVQLNYTDRVGRRRLIVNTDRHTFEADLVAGTLAIDDQRQTFAVERDATYLALHRAMLGPAQDAAGLVCSLDEGLRTLALIAAAEASVARRTWETS